MTTNSIWRVCWLCSLKMSALVLPLVWMAHAWPILAWSGRELAPRPLLAAWLGVPVVEVALRRVALTGEHAVEGSVVGRDVGGHPALPARIGVLRAARPGLAAQYRTKLVYAR
jgi:hypothetical protein